MYEQFSRDHEREVDWIEWQAGHVAGSLLVSSGREGRGWDLL